ncbi:MAG: formate dehydrogenase subunit alpha [Rhodospirillales bacterium]|jgi:formate dehydrogenase major subunit|nr:formate dehydrogenase subunit alpha [Rhodospirillales bacterium]MBT4625839.1 formate dehydrogenase subunit alpha [Rhodospirillales bacterium]MBT5351653.1 formate dehydrogenase subunit alpha [Rhodospirillales bacterium]MBT5521330.1 formate dehydrogenase subunit alpha [Rhodospirillales bacterium]MBT6109593.1 formate dehydrogenase subunit alpha [Rhodospirillales bacterium]
MTDQIKFTLNGKEVEAGADETIWQISQREGVEIPHLCYSPEPGFRGDGNCRACMVEVEGERVLAASCIRMPTEGMVVNSASERAKKSRELVFELLVADQPERATSHDPDSKFWNWADKVGVDASRFAAAESKPSADNSHVAMAVNLDACINCNLCVRACREVQVNDVIGMSFRGSGSKITFDFNDPMGDSTCVACGECVQACPTGALMEASLLDDKGTRTVYADRTVDTVCPFCGVGCQTKVHIKDDKIVKVDGRSGPANENRLCVKGRFGYDYIAHAHRLTTPLIRRDDAPKDWQQHIKDGDWQTVFREASWDEALDAAAGGLKKTYESEGPKGLAGFGSAKGSNEEAYLFQKLIRTAFHTNNVDHCTRLCHASSVAALMECVASGAVSAPFTDAETADCVIAIGCNPAQNHPVAATYFKQAAKQGTKVFIMDPRGQMMSRYATDHLHFKPGSDVAMLNAMIHTIVEEELYDVQYIQANTEGFDALKDHIKDYSPEAMTEICGIDPDTLRKVARTYAKSDASIIFWGMGVSQHIHGTDNARCLITLALITGQIGRPGTGLHPLRGQNNVQGASDVGLIPICYPDYKSVENADVRERFEELWGTDLDAKKGLTVVEIIDAIHDGTIKAMYVEGENPAMSDPDQSHARQALAMLDHLVVQDIFLTETAWHADVVLPASAHAEKVGTFSNTNRQVQMVRECVPMPGDARHDWWIITEVGKRLGLDWTYTGPADVFAEMKLAMPSLDNITWERLETENVVTYPCDDPTSFGNPVIFIDGFPTASGRAKIVPASIIPPDEVPDDEYPLVLTTGRMLEHWHTGSMTRRATVLDALEPEAVVSLNRSDMLRLGIEAGDMAAVHTRRGTITLTVRQNPNQPEGLVFIPFCFAEAPANVLTNPKLDPFGKIPEFKFCAARVEKVEDAQAAE